MRKNLFLIASLFMLVLVVAGCGEGENEKNANVPTGDNENAVIEEKAIEPEKVLIEGAGERILELTEGLSYFTIVESIEVYQQGDETWAVVKTGEIKDYDDGGWSEEIARLTILNAYGNVIYLDKVLVVNADNIQVASMWNWLSKE